MPRHTPAALFLAALAAAPLPAARATWSIILIDTRTGEIAVGSATCITNFDLREGTPVLIPGVGAATAQSFVDSTGQNRVFIRDRLAEGAPPGAILAQLASFDAGHATRQYGIVDAAGRSATFSGAGAGAWAGGQTGTFTSNHAGHQSTIAYAIQGNVLTGEPVVAQAVQAVISTQGDLAAKMMAGMQAARLMGGDGRCSCSSGPTGCGSPPPNFTKSAHIGYMLIARAGDREGSDGIYRAAAGSSNIAVHDVNADGLPDLLISNLTNSSLSVQANSTTPAAPFPKFTSLPTNYSTTVAGGAPRGITTADVDADGLQDVLIAASSSGAVVIFPALPSPAGAFGAPAFIPVGTSPRVVAAADFNGDGHADFAAMNTVGNTISVRLNDGSGQFTALPDIPTPAGPLDMIAGDFAGSPHPDLAVMCRTAGSLVILAGDGAGQFTPAHAFTIPTSAIAITSGHFDADNRPDLALVTDTTRQLIIYLNQSGAWAPATHTLTEFSTLADVAAGDIDGDGRTDLVPVGGPRFATFINTGQGVFEHTRTYRVLGSALAAALADLDADGDLDLAIPSSNLGASMVVQNYGAFFNDGVGCATGDYFMNFNIAFQSAAAPDPVIQLQSLYDQWRTDQLGVPDAVTSNTSIAASWLPANGAASTNLHITLRDWTGALVTIPAQQITVEHAPASAASSSIGPVTPVGNGAFTATITAGLEAGIDRFRVVVTPPLPPGSRPVILMPDAILTIAPACYANCDNSPAAPVLNIADFSCFLAKFAAQDGYANCDLSNDPPIFNVADFSCFLTKFAAGCP